jgi:hypothetical protein
VSRRAGSWLGILVLTLGTLSCNALPRPGVPGESGTPPVEDLPSTDIVPLDWGALVSATPIPETAATALWFQDDSGTVRAVGFDHQRKKLWEGAVVIRRR